MINLTELLEELDSSISWNRRIPKAIKQSVNSTDSVSKIFGKKQIFFKDKYGYQIKDDECRNILLILANKETDSLLKIKLEKASLEIELDILRNEHNKLADKNDEILNAVNFEGWDVYNHETLTRLKEASTRRESSDVITEYFLVISNYTTIGNVRTLLTSMRALIGDNEVLLDEFRLPTRLNDFLVMKSENIKNTNITSTKKEIIKLKNIKKMIDDNLYFLDGLSEPSRYSLKERWRIITKLLATLTMCGGNRTIELVKSGVFAPITSQPNFIKFSGQAKIRTQARAEAFEITKPLLFIDAETFIKHVETLRKFIGKRTIDQSNKKINTSLTQGISNNWLEDVIKFDVNVKGKLKGLRALYAVTTEKVFNQSDLRPISQQKYISNVLGHLEYEKTTWEHYFAYFLDTRGFNLKRFLTTFKKENDEK